MLNLQLNVQPKTAQRLRRILELHPDEESFAQHIISYQITELKRSIIDLRIDILEYEKKYQLTSDDFYHRFNQGNTDDSDDYILWAGLYEMLRKNEKRLQALQ